MNADDLRAEYDQVCKNHDAIANFRATLLGLIPFVSATGFLVLLGSDIAVASAGVLVPLALFGFLVTTGLFFYEVRGVANCKSLIHYGQQLETAMKFKGLWAAAQSDKRLKEELETHHLDNPSSVASACDRTQLAKLAQSWGGRFGSRPSHRLGFIGAEAAGYTVYLPVLLAWSCLLRLGWQCGVAV